METESILHRMCNSKAILVVWIALLAACQPMSPSGPPSGRPGTSIAKPQVRPEAPVLVRLPNGHYRVKRPWNLEFDGYHYVIPAGYTSNGITAPARLKASLGDGVAHRETWAAVFHDWLFTRKGNRRSEADRRFYQLLLAYGVNERKAALMYSTVSAYSLSKEFN